MIKPFLKYPGGILDYLALFLGQLYYFPVAGAIMLGLLCWMGSLLTFLILRVITNKHPRKIVVIIPAFVLLALFSQYDFPLATVLGWIVAMIAFLLYLKGIKLSPTMHILSGLLLGIFLYYFACGQVWGYIILVWFHQFLIDKKYIKGVINLVLLGVPFLAAFLLFKIDLQKAFLYHLLPVADIKTGVTPLVMYGYYLFLILYISIAKRYLDDKTVHVLHMPHKTVERIVLFVFLIGVIYFSIIYAYPRYDKPLVSMDYHIQHGNWEKVIDLQYDYRLETRYIVCATNRALYHTGELLKNMFSFPQKRGDVALFLNEKEDDYGPLFRSELFYELGFLDESLMCCYESISLNGETPWNLRQLALIRMANRDSLGAVEVLSKLKQTFLFWDWARHYSHVLESDSLFNADPVFTAKIPASEAPELEGFFDGPAEKLELMLKRDPDNRMVFEYLIAYYLFSWDFEKIVEHLPQFEPYIQFRLPRHIQEAMVMYNDRHPFSQDFFDGLRINKRLDARYNTYRKLLAIHRIKKVDAAKKMRNSFGHTFWYYTVFPPTETVDYQHLEKQVKQAIRKKEDLIDDLQDQVKQAVRNKNDLLKRLVKEYENRN